VKNWNVATQIKEVDIRKFDNRKTEISLFFFFFRHHNQLHDTGDYQRFLDTLRELHVLATGFPSTSFSGHFFIFVFRLLKRCYLILSQKTQLVKIIQNAIYFFYLCKR
jgi:hypothetical protein